MGNHNSYSKKLTSRLWYVIYGSKWCVNYFLKKIIEFISEIVL